MRRNNVREQCFTNYDSNPPVCGVHKVTVIEKQIPIDALAPELGSVVCNLCPVSQAVVREVRSPYAQRAN